MSSPTQSEMWEEEREEALLGQVQESEDEPEEDEEDEDEDEE